jgi:tetratricopeptide (TPR) repeat protein
MAKRKRLLVLLSALVVLLGLAAALGARWYRTTRPDYRLRCGYEALARGDRNGAERLVLLLQAGGARDHAELLRAEVLFAQAKPFLDADQPEAAAPLLRRAVEACNKISDRGEIRLQAAALTGRCFLYLHEPAQAARAFDFVVTERPEHADAHRGLAAIYYDQGALTRALQQLEEVARLDPGDGRPHRMMGHIYKELEQYDRAAAAFQEALTRRLSNDFAADARANLAECLVKEGRHAEALWTLDACDPDARRSPNLLTLRAECLAAQGQGEEARSLLDAALSAHPSSLDLLRLRARLHREAGEVKAEAGLLERILAIDRHDYTSRYQLAQAYETLGRSAEAAEQRRLCQQTQQALAEMTKLHEEAVENPWDAGVRRRLAEICRQLDRPDQAELWLQAAAACDQAQPFAQPKP